MKPSKIVWHYSQGMHFRKIIDCGVLMPSEAPTRESRPILWFSLNQVWEAYCQHRDFPQREYP